MLRFRREVAAPGSGVHVSRSCTDLKAALGAPAVFAGVLSPATPLHADVLAVKPRAVEPALSASCLDGTPGAA